MIILQGDHISEVPDPEPEDRFELVMQHPFSRPRRDSVQVVLYLGEVIIGIAAASASIRALTETVVRATESLPVRPPFPDDGSVLASGAMAAVASLRNASLDITGTFDGPLSDEGLDSLAAMMELDMPPRRDSAAAAARQAREDALLSLRIQGGNSFRVAAGAVKVNFS